jgi:hypothetical protein
VGEIHRSGGQARAELSARLRARLPEIEDATLTRVYGVAEPGRSADPRYVEGLRAAVSAAIDYGLESVEFGERVSAVPVILLAQARVAARNNVSLDTVLRRYVAGYTLLGDFLVEEANQSGLNGVALKGLLRTQAALLERVLAAVGEEHAREGGGRLRSAEQRRIKRVEGLLAGRLVDTSDLAYGFDAHHLGLVVAGPEAEKHLTELAMTLDRRLLAIPGDQEAVWAWLGARRTTDPRDLEHLVLETWPAHLSLAVGEPATGFAGWRMTHQQARAAFPIAVQSLKRLALYADVALLASVLQDDLLSTSLRNLYLAPLANERDGGAGLRETLRAYFAAECNTSSTAAALGVSRQTVINLVRVIEYHLDRPLHTCTMELEIALKLDELGSSTSPPHAVLFGG